MHFLDLTLAFPSLDLALDEALLLEAEDGVGPEEVLRIWESPMTMIVMGRSGKIEREINAAECRRRNVPVFRRASGGGTVVLGRGCLTYAVILPYSKYARLRMLDEAHAYVLEKIAAAINERYPGVSRQGISDLTFQQNGAARKFSGNSLRCRREHFLYHGTILYDFDLSLVSSLLAHPPREPEYRDRRPHGDFIANLPIAGEILRAAISSAFGRTIALENAPLQRTERLASSYLDLTSKI